VITHVTRTAQSELLFPRSRRDSGAEHKAEMMPLSQVISVAHGAAARKAHNAATVHCYYICFMCET